jgi:hypothetical protein
MTTTLPADPKYIFSPPETPTKYAQPEGGSHSINSGDVYMCLHIPALPEFVMKYYIKLPAIIMKYCNEILYEITLALLLGNAAGFPRFYFLIYLMSFA